MKNKEKPHGMNSVYLSGKREWNERNGNAIKQKNTAYKITFLSLIISVFAVAGLAYMSTQNKLIPYFVAVDKTGAVKAVQRADKINLTEDEKKNVIKSDIGTFISSKRTIYSDPLIQKNAILETYHYLSSSHPAYQKVNSEFQKNSPFDRMKTQSVNIKIIVVNATSKDSYQVDWIETTFDKQGKITAIDDYKSAITVINSTPITEAGIQKNPIGTFIFDYDTSKIIK